MKRIWVKLSELKPNPYKKFIGNGEIDEDVVLQILESAERTSLWEQWVVRETESGYQLAFGHNRLAAARKLLGADGKVSVQVEDYSDPQMYVAMADENSGDEELITHQVDVVRKAQQLLTSNPLWCKHLVGASADRTGTSKFARHDNQHVHGSVDCILAFLGEKNWSHTKVVNLLQLAENADPSVLQATISRKSRHSTRGQIGRRAVMALSDLPKQVQRAAVEVIEKLDVAIPADAIKDAVEEVESLPPSRKEAGIKRAINRKADTQRIEEIKRKRKQENKGKPKAAKTLPDLSSVLISIRLYLESATQNLEDLLPHKEAVQRDANFAGVDQACNGLQNVINKLRPEKQRKEALRIAHIEFLKLGSSESKSN